MAEKFYHLLGLDENGLGPRLGPLVVTAVHAKATEKAKAQLNRRLPKALRDDLNDSKVLVSCHDSSLGEAWARALVFRMTGEAPGTPEDLLKVLVVESTRSLQKDCPKSTRTQCWNTEAEAFSATEEQLTRVGSHFAKLEARGLFIERAAVELTCTGRLNALKAAGVHRFAADLHAMERLVLHLREQAAAPVIATCGKVGGIGKYEPFFGPLAGRLHVALEEGRALSHYSFPALGELKFVRDADATDPLVMMASLIGKYVRELLMSRISRFYRPYLSDPERTPSGYHDPVTAQFVTETEPARRRLSIVEDCFERRPAAEFA